MVLTEFVLITMLEKEMLEAADALDFEKAARLRDRIKELEDAPELVSDRDHDVADPAPTKGPRRQFRRRRSH